jgi:hypothetical protein
LQPPHPTHPSQPPGDPRGITPLERALHDSDPDVRKLAKLALTSIQMAKEVT